MKVRYSLLLVCLLLIGFMSCNSSEKEVLSTNPDQVKKSVNTKPRILSEAFKTYWYAGTAEITSYSLRQERYGELREGTAVNIFVTEDFLPKEQVKADRSSEKNIPVLKLNQTKNYLTGIYPYSIMTSTFSPVNNTGNALKVTHSMQEWCGHVYAQLNNRKKYEIEAHSYFEGEADQNFEISKTWLENELWNLIRVNPEELPTGEFSIIPSFEYFRMSHQPMEQHMVTGNLVKGDSISTYSLDYDGLSRSLRIYFNSEFPFTIERWEETHPNGLTTKAKKIKRLRTAYWRKNANSYGYLRDSLGI